jgi:ubiquinone/menaquinone biosynthesis C-methylase UbiE
MVNITKGAESIREMYRQNEVAKGYEEARFSSFLGKLTDDMEIKAIESALEQTHPQKLLEIAVGPGRVSKSLDFFDLAVGIDTSYPMLKIARENVENQRWSFLNANVMNMPYYDESFDAIVTFRLLRHFTKEERTRAYREIHRVLKNDGILILDALNSNTGIITKIFDKTYRYVLQITAKLIRGKSSGIYDVLYTKEYLEKELMDFGFQIKSINGIIHAYNLYFPFNLPFEFLRYIKMDKNPLYRVARDKLLSIAIRNEHHRSKKLDNSFSWVIVCVKK